MGTVVRLDKDSYKNNEMLAKYNNFDISIEEFTRLDRIRRQKQNRDKLILNIANTKLFLDIFCKMYSQYLEYNLQKNSFIYEEELNDITKLILHYQKEINWLNREQKKIEYNLFDNLIAQAALEHSRGLEYEKARLADLRSRKKIRQNKYEREIASLAKRFEYYETNKSISSYTITSDKIEAHLNCVM